MPILETQLNARSADFQANAAAMRALVADLNAQTDKAAMGGGNAARAKHTARGKLLPRDRVHNLLDAGTPFLEIAPSKLPSNTSRYSRIFLNLSRNLLASLGLRMSGSVTVSIRGIPDLL